MFRRNPPEPQYVIEITKSDTIDRAAAQRAISTLRDNIGFKALLHILRLTKSRVDSKLLNDTNLDRHQFTYLQGVRCGLGHVEELLRRETRELEETRPAKPSEQAIFEKAKSLLIEVK